MKNSRSFGLFLLLFLGAPYALLQSQESIRVMPLLEKDLNAYTKENIVLTVGEITLPPGATGSGHRHPGPTFVYVLEGAVEIELEGAPAKVYRAGDSFYEDAHQLHISTKNVSATELARILAYHLSRKGEKLTEPERP
jgi:quercetin dioxygenase-like cupin family protein